MGTFRYVLADVFTDTAAGGQPARASSPTPAGWTTATMQALDARAEVQRDACSCCRRSRAGTCGSGSSRPPRRSRSPGTRASARRSCSPGRCRSSRSAWRPGKGIVPVTLEREGPKIVFGRMVQPIPTVAPYADADELLAALGVERSELPVELYDNGLPHVYVCLASREAVAAVQPDMKRLSDAARPRMRDQLLRRRGPALEDADVRARGRHRTRTRRRARRPGRSRCTRRGTGGSRSATRSRSSRAPRSGARRSSTPAWTARPTRSSASRSAAPRSSSRAASSGFRRPTA